MNAKKARKMLKAAKFIAKKARSREFVESGRGGAMLEVSSKIAEAVDVRMAMPHLTVQEWRRLNGNRN